MGFIEDYLSKISCHHKWERYKTVNLYDKDGNDLPVRIIEILICEKCGKIKKIVT